MFSILDQQKVLKMFKLLVAVAVLAVYVSCDGPIAGGIKQLGYIPSEVEDFARRNTNELAGLTNFDGSYTVLKIRNVRVQIVAGIRYYFTVDVLTQRQGSTKYGVSIGL